jgi:hypothetical protein
MDRVQEELENKRLNAKNKVYDVDKINEESLSKKYDFEDEYLSDNAKKEKKQEILKKQNKRTTKKRKFIPFIIGSLAVALVGTGAYNLGKQKGTKEQEEKIFSTIARTCNISNAQPQILNAWANDSIGKLEKYVENTGIRNGNEILENIKSEYLSKVVLDYENFIDSNGNIDEYNKLIDDSKKLENRLNDTGYNIDFSFSNSDYAYMVLVDPNNHIVNNLTTDQNLSMYVADEFYNGESFSADSILSNDGIVYSPYQKEENVKTLN